MGFLTDLFGGKKDAKPVTTNTQQSSQTTTDVAGWQMPLFQQLIDADMARYNYGQNADWDNLSRFAAMMNGLPDFSSTSQTTTQNQSKNRLMGALGGGLGAFAATGNPWMAALGAAGGAFG